MRVLLSGLGRLNDDARPARTHHLTDIPLQMLERFAARVRQVAVRLEPVPANSMRMTTCRVTVHPPRGAPLNASGDGPDAISATRAALARVRRLLRRDAGRRLAKRPRVAMA